MKRKDDRIFFNVIEVLVFSAVIKVSVLDLNMCHKKQQHLKENLYKQSADSFLNFLILKTLNIWSIQRSQPCKYFV